MTRAEQIALLADNDGTRWTKAFVEECRSAPSITCFQGMIRYEFSDGSAIVESEEGWDIEGSTPFSWEGAEKP